MKQFIQLRIQNFIPNIYLVNNNGAEKKITLKDENLLENINLAANKLHIDLENSLESPEKLYSELLSTARESDETYMIEDTQMNQESIEFNIRSLIDELLGRAERMEQEYKDIDMNEETRAEINQNQSRDILASILEEIYLRLTAKTLIAASELGITEIHLQDDHKNGRLAEKMNKELGKMGAELIVD